MFSLTKTTLDGDGCGQPEERDVDDLRIERRSFQRLVLRHRRADQEDEVQIGFRIH
jgi:hypothetical protein